MLKTSWIEAKQVRESFAHQCCGIIVGNILANSETFVDIQIKRREKVKNKLLDRHIQCDRVLSMKSFQIVALILRIIYPDIHSMVLEEPARRGQIAPHIDYSIFLGYDTANGSILGYKP